MVFSCLHLAPPYTRSACRCNNEVMLNRVLDMLEKALPGTPAALGTALGTPSDEGGPKEGLPREDVGKKEDVPTVMRGLADLQQASEHSANWAASTTIMSGHFGATFLPGAALPPPPTTIFQFDTPAPTAATFDFGAARFEAAASPPTLPPTGSAFHFEVRAEQGTARGRKGRAAAGRAGKK